MDKLQKLIDKIVNDSLNEEYFWEKNIHGDMTLLFMKVEMSSVHIVPSTIYSATKDNKTIAIGLSSMNKPFLVLKNSLTQDTQVFVISIQSYYRLKTIIDNQLLTKEKIIDDFLDS